MSVKPVRRRQIIQQIARDNGLTLEEVELAVRSQFHFVQQTMKAGHFDQVRLPLFGRFYVNPKRLEHLQRAAAQSQRRRAKLALQQ